ncbi:MAG: FtsX-like permease family protein [Planctomycetes bacterium]|nr:FtsX-like permease family protein [Planctomycetota bacterium]
MRALDRKLLRDVWEMKGQTIAICLVIACGVATFVMSLTTIRSLSITQSTYYERYHFADVFSQVKRAPKTLEARIADIPGVARLQTRVVADVTLDVPGLAEPAVGRLISLPDRGEPVLNRLYLRSGRFPEPGRKGEVVASEAFVLAHQMEPGARLQAVINGHKQELIIVGVVLSPEYVFQIKAGDLLPDTKRFGVFWMGELDLSAAFNMQGAFNDISLSLMPGASEEEVLLRLNRLTAPYGGDGAYGRYEQVSNRYLSDEIKQLQAQGVIAPVLFLSVAAFLLNVVLSRLISTQREQIAALKAFGYTHWEVGLHYLKLVLVIVVVGVGLGASVGAWLGKGLTELYTKFYRFPVFTYDFHPGIVLAALAVASAAAVLGTLGAVRKAVKLPPAEAMRPEPPAHYRPTLLERLGLQRLFSPAARMVLRHLERKPWQAGLSVVGIALATSILVLGAFSEDAVFYLMEFQFRLSQRQDVTVTFVEPSSVRSLYAVKHLPGVHDCEPFRSVPARLRFGPRSKRMGIMGLPSERHLNRVLDKNERSIELPEQGLVLSAKLAELLRANVGDLVTVEVMEGRRPVREVPVVGLIEDFTGINAYMHLKSLQDLTGEGRSYSGAFLSVDSDRTKQLYLTLKQTPKVAGVTVQEAAERSFQDTIAENLMVMRLFNVIFASIIAAGVVYNTARISLSERSRELATLRVMGFTRAEISAILLGELGVLTLVAIPLGLVLGYLFAALATTALATDLFRIPLIVHRSTYAFAASVILIATLLSGLLVRRKLDHLDLVAVLKSRE